MILQLSTGVGKGIVEVVNSVNVITRGIATPDDDTIGLGEEEETDEGDEDEAKNAVLVAHNTKMTIPANTHSIAITINRRNDIVRARDGDVFVDGGGGFDNNNNGLVSGDGNGAGVGTGVGRGGNKVRISDDFGIGCIPPRPFGVINDMRYYNK